MRQTALDIFNKTKDLCGILLLCKSAIGLQLFDNRLVFCPDTDPTESARAVYGCYGYQVKATSRVSV